MVELRLTAKLGAGSCLGPEEGEEMPVDEEEEDDTVRLEEDALRQTTAVELLLVLLMEELLDSER